MSAIAVGHVRTKPGHLDDFRTLCAELGKIAKKHGLGTRLYFNFLAGSDVNTHAFIYEAADLASLGAGLEAFGADPAFSAVNARMFGENGIATVISFSQANEIPL